MQVTIDKRVELINVIQHLADGIYKQRFPGIFVGYQSYSKKIEEHFGKFASHDAIKLFSQSGVLANGFTLPIYFALQDLDENFVFNPNVDINDDMKKFVEALPDFAKITGFDDWFKSNQEFYEECIKQYSDMIDKSNFENAMQSFYGKNYDTSINRGVVLLPSLSDCNGFVNTSHGQYCAVSSSEDFSKDKIRFTSQKALEEGNAHTLWHEFSHPIINPLVSEYFKTHEEINLENEVTKSHGMYHGEGLINETIVEAIVCHILRSKKFNKDANERIQARKEVGQYLIQPLCEKLEQDYIPNKDKYKGFSEYFPQVMEFLKACADNNKEVH